MTDDDWLARTRTSYDTVADSYAELLGASLDDDPHDRGVLAWFAELVRAAGGGAVVDVGCGPGHVTAHLRRLGLDASGLDLSPGMVARARRDHPGATFEVGSMTDLDLPEASVAGLLLWYSLVHVPDAVVPGVLVEVARVLRPGGVLLVGFHVGDRRTHKCSGYGGHPMDVHVHRRPLDRVSAWVREAGLVVEGQVHRDPGTDDPHGRLLARRP